MNNLPVLGDYYRQYFNPETEALEIRRKSRADGLLGVNEFMELVAALCQQHQLSFIPHKTEKNLIMLPYAFVRPSEGDKIVNKTTGEVYTIDQIILNPVTQKWAGLVRLDLVTPPSIEERHVLAYLDKRNYINFDHVYPDSIANIVGTNSDEVMKSVPPMRPTVTWDLVRVEPGGLGKPFDSKKEFKPRVREMYKDPLSPGYTVVVTGKTFDNIIQFDSWSNDHRTSSRLIKWFENFLNTYTGYFRQYGVGHFFFWQRKDDDLNKTWRQTFAVKSTQYFLKTEELEANYERDILKIDISLGTASFANDRLHTEHRYIADQLVTGRITEDDYYRLFNNSGEYQFGEVEFIQ